MATCTKCRKKVRINSRNCPYCGAPAKGGTSLMMTVFTITAMLWAIGTFLGPPG